MTKALRKNLTNRIKNFDKMAETISNHIKCGQFIQEFQKKASRIGNSIELFDLREQLQNRITFLQRRYNLLISQEIMKIISKNRKKNQRISIHTFTNQLKIKNKELIIELLKKFIKTRKIYANFDNYNEDLVLHNR